MFDFFEPLIRKNIGKFLSLAMIGFISIIFVSIKIASATYGLISSLF